MRPISTCLLVALALAGAATGSGAAKVTTSPTGVLVNTHDRFEVTGTRIACRVLRKSAGVTNRLVCFRETKQGSFIAGRGTYGIELAEGGFAVARVGVKRLVFSRSEVAPAGPAAGSTRAKAALGGTVSLGTRQDKAFVAGTNIVCRPFGHTRIESLLCVLVGRDGHIHDGTYLVFISEHGVVIAQARNGRAVTIFQRVHGR
jgi:hypothetical protein